VSDLGDRRAAPARRSISRAWRAGASAVAASLAVVAGAAVTRAEDGGCAGTLAGAVKGTFACDALVTTGRDGKAYFDVRPRGPIDGVPSYAPGTFELPPPVAAGTYTLETLGLGRASVAAPGGALYTATKTSGRRGEVTLTLASVRRVSQGAFAVHGTYRARLLPAGAGKSGEVVVEVRF
jgi:hypothetical protein